MLRVLSYKWVLLVLLLVGNLFIYCLMLHSDSQIRLPEEMYIARSSAGEMIEVEVLVDGGYWSPVHLRSFALFNMILVLLWLICFEVERQIACKRRACEVKKGEVAEQSVDSK